MSTQQPETTTTSNIQASRTFFGEQSSTKEQGTNDQIEAYFSEQYWTQLTDEEKYRNNHQLSPLTPDHIANIGAVYEKMVPLVQDTHAFLQGYAPSLVSLWQASDTVTKEAYKTVLTDIVKHSPDFLEKHRGQDDDQYEADCLHAVQWLGMWLESRS